MARRRFKRKPRSKRTQLARWEPHQLAAPDPTALGLGIGGTVLLLGGAAAVVGLIFWKRNKIAEVIVKATGVGVMAYNEKGTGLGLRPFTTMEDQEIWNAAVGPIKNKRGERSAAMYEAVIDQFQVKTNPRYVPRNGQTFCNIFASDVMRAMGYELPWTHANELTDWLAGDVGDDAAGGQGWYEVVALDAQEMANLGMPVLAAWHNKSGTGHVMVVGPGNYDTRLGPAGSGAGRALVSHGHMANGFDLAPMPFVRYFANS